MRESIVEEINRYVNIIHNFILVPSIVFSFLHNCFDLLLLKMARKRNALLPMNRVKAIAEELAGFFLTQVIPESGEFHYIEK